MTMTVRAAAVAVLVGLAGAACTTTRAAVPLDRPALDVPPPPPRVIVPLPRPQPAQLEPVQELGPAPLNIPKPRVQRENPSPKVEPKPEEPKPVEPPPVAPPVTAPVQPPAAAPQLRLPESSGSPQASQIQDAIGRSREILRKVASSGAQLSEGARKAVKEAEVLAAQAEDALNKDNLPLAKELADKAERLANSIQR